MVGLLMGCKPEKPTEYSHVVPATATELAVIDLQALVQKAGLDTPDRMATLQKFATLLLEANEGVSQEAQRLLNDPAASGIDWRSPALLFQAPQLSAGALALRIENLPQWEQVVETLVKAEVCSAPRKGKQCHFTELTGTGIGLYYNNGTLLGIYAGTPERLRQLNRAAEEMMGQSAEQSIQSHPQYARLMKQEGDIRLLATPEALPFEIRGVLKYPAGTPLVGQLLFGDGRIDAVVQRADFEGESRESSTAFRPSNSTELQGAMMAVLHGRPFHIELGRDELLTISGIGVMREFAPDEPEIELLCDLIDRVESLTLRGDTNRTRFMLLLTNRQENALKQIADFAQSFLF